MKMRSFAIVGFVLLVLISLNSVTVFAEDEPVKLVHLNEKFNLTIGQVADMVDYSDMMIKLLEIDPICYLNESCPTVVPSATFEVRYNKTVKNYTDQAYGDFIAIHGVEIDLQKIDTIMDTDGVYTTFIVRESSWQNPQPTCTEGEIKNYICSEGEVPWCRCENKEWVCIISPEIQCSATVIYGIHAILGEMFKLQETQPVKIINYLDKNNNPLRIYLLDINKEDQSIKLEVFFSDKSEIVKVPLTEAKIVFGAVINFISIDDSWEYATLRVSYVEQIPPEEPEPVPPEEYCDTSWYYIFKDDVGYNEAYNDLTEPEELFMGTITYDFDEKCQSAILQRCTPYKLDGMSIYIGSKDLEKYKGYKVEIVGKKNSFGLEGYQLEEIWFIKIRCIEEVPIAKIVPIEKATAVRVTKTLTTLEQVKANTPEQATGIETAQDKILEVNTEAGKFEQEINERGFGYKFKWFFGMVAEQEKEDAIFFNEQAIKLSETAQLLLQISEQVEEPAKSILVEESTKLQEQSQEFLQKAEDKEKHSKGLLSWIGL